MSSQFRCLAQAASVLLVLAAQLFAQGTERVSVLVELAPGATRDAVRAFAARQGGHVRYEYRILPRVMNLRNMPVAALNGLRNMRGVVRVTQDPVIQANLQESTALIRGLQSQIQSAGLAANGAGVRICVTDTGIDSNHWMFQDWPDTTKTRIDSDAALNLVGAGFPEDDQGHGSHVSGIAAGREGLFFNGLPLQGVAPKATIIPVKVLNSAGEGAGSDLIAAFQHCTDPSLPHGPAQVISVSLGFGPFVDRAACDAEPVVAAANAAVDAGAVVVAASGNDSSANAMAAPACGSKVISVGATWDYTGLNSIDDFFYCMTTATVDTVLCFSDKSPMLDVTAPGCSIHSAAADLSNNAPNAVTAMCGTSQAAPHVAGLAALLRQQNPALTPAGVRACIRNGADDKGAAGFDSSYGYGRINVTNSLTLCSPAGPVNQPPAASFTSNCADRACTVTSTSTDADGTLVSQAWTFGDGGGGSGAVVSHTYSADGTFNVTLTVTDDGGATAATNANVSVSANKPPVAGFTYSCTGLACGFDGSGSSDPDGSIYSYVWSFGDGGTATGVTASHTYGAGGTYTAALTVTDNKGATQSTSQTLTVTPPSGGISLTARGYKVKGKQRADLTWTGAAGTSVDIFRNAVKITTTPNDGSHTDAINKSGSATYQYRVCNAGTTACSNTATVVF